MATRFIYRCAECGDTTPIPEGAVTPQSEVPAQCRRGHVDSWQVHPITESTPEDRSILYQIRTVAARRRGADTELRRLVVVAVGREIPVREIAEAAGVSPQTPLNWVKGIEPGKEDLK